MPLYIYNEKLFLSKKTNIKLGETPNPKADSFGIIWEFTYETGHFWHSILISNVAKSVQ